jgi:hypothetical protein
MSKLSKCINPYSEKLNIVIKLKCATQQVFNRYSKAKYIKINYKSLQLPFRGWGQTKKKWQIILTHYH